MLDNKVLCLEKFILGIVGVKLCLIIKKIKKIINN